MTENLLPVASTDQSSVIPYQLRNTLFKVGRFVLEQGTHQDHSSFALSFISRYYQALNLWPLEFTERIFEHAKKLNAQDRVALGQTLSNQLRPWLPPHIDELKIADFFRSICLVLDQCDGNLLTLLSAFNEEILSPIKTRLNPRKLIEVEERMGTALYLAVLELEEEAPSQFIPKSRWPQISEYTLLQSLPPINDIFPFVALRNSDHIRCTLYVSDQPIHLLPNIELSEWPIHCVQPLESGRSESKSNQNANQELRELYWISIPSTGPIRLTQLLPFTDIYTALYIGEQLLETLGALHQLGISFRSLSPNEVVIDHRFQLQLLPFLEYQTRDRAWAGDSTLKVSEFNSIYISPEQRLGQRGDLRSDLWSFGAIFYELVMKTPLIQNSSLLGLSELDSTSGIMPLGDEFTNNLKLIVKRCLHPNPDHRWSDAQRVLENYRPIANEVRQTLKSRGRSAQWTRVIGEGVLRSFIDQNIHAPPHPVNPAFFSYLEDQEIPLSTAEDPSALLTTIFAQEEALNEDIGKWSILLDEAEQAQRALILRIKDEVPAITYEHLEDLVEEKVLIKEALLQAESKIAFFERRRPKLFALALERFIEDSELNLDLQELLNLDWSTVDSLPDDGTEQEAIPVSLNEAQADFDDLEQDFVDESTEQEELLEALEAQSIKISEESLQIDEVEAFDDLDHLSGQELLTQQKIESQEIESQEIESQEIESQEIEPQEIMTDPQESEEIDLLEALIDSVTHSDSVQTQATVAEEAVHETSDYDQDIMVSEVNDEVNEQDLIPSQERVTIEVAEVSAELIETNEVSQHDVSNDQQNFNQESDIIGDLEQVLRSEKLSSELLTSSDNESQNSLNRKLIEDPSEESQEHSTPSEDSSSIEDPNPPEDSSPLEIANPDITTVKASIDSAAIKSIEDFADLSILERDQLPEEEVLTDDFEFGDLTGIEDLPEKEPEDPLFGGLGADDPLRQMDSYAMSKDQDYAVDHNSELSSEDLAMSESESESESDFMEVSIDTQSIEYKDSDAVFTSAPLPVYSDDLSLDMSIEDSELDSESESAEPESDSELESRMHNGLETQLKTDQIIDAGQSNSLDGALEPESTLEPSIVISKESIANASVELPNEEMLASLSQLIELEAEGASKQIIMTPLPQVLSMTTDERRQLFDLYERYVKLKEVYNDAPDENLNFEDFRKEIDLAREMAVDVHGWEAVRFTVKVKDGKVVLKAKKAQVST